MFQLNISTDLIRLLKAKTEITLRVDLEGGVFADGGASSKNLNY